MAMRDNRDRLRILVVTRSYPAPGDLYQYPFVHRRVLAYLAAGHEVTVFRPSERPGGHRFDGIVCLAGDRGALSSLAQIWKPDVIAVHGFSEALWPVIEPLAGHFPICAWLHGSEIPAIARFKAQHDGTDEERSAAVQQVERRCAFWQQFLSNPPANFSLVFVSESAAGQAQEDMGQLLRDWTVIHNPIDTELFEYRPRAANDRFNILMIRPFDSYGYGNDLAVSAISSLSLGPGFGRLQFTIIGDGPMFEATLRPIRHLANVRVERRFLPQAEIARLHAEHGIFLVPTRIDTQGVSRDEAMASGLVPVTNVAGAVTEFVDADCAALAPANDAEALADGLWEMVEDAELFARRSAAAAGRVRKQSCSKLIIPQELALLEAAANG
jgi:glycosyltransferase involved in cell wall biosynthesis